MSRAGAPPPAAGRPAVFLDRDGTVIEEEGFLDDPAKLRLTPGAAKALARLRDAGYALHVISNQSGIGRGFITRETVEKIHARLREELAAAGVVLDGIEYCQHAPDAGCECRKPATGLLEPLAAREGFDLTRSVVVGDRMSDLGLAKRIGARAVLVETGYGRSVRRESRVLSDHIAPNLAESVDWILGGATGGGAPASLDAPCILIVRLGALGDGVHSLPLLMALRRAYPKARIEWAAGPALAKFLAGHPAIDAIRVVARGAHGLLRAAGEIRGRFDIALDPQGLLKSAFLAWQAAPRRIGFARPRERAAALLYTDRVSPEKWIHVIEENLALLAPLSLTAGRIEYGIPAAPLRDDLADGLRGRPLGLAPGGGWATKRWPVADWIALARAAEKRGPVVVVWGPGEEAEARQIAEASGARLLPPTTFRDLAAVFPHLRGLVAVESGPLHLAAALGVPTTALIGPTDPRRNGAFGRGHRAIWGRVPCSPCYARRCANWICMETIEPETVFRVALPEAGR